VPSGYAIHVGLDRTSSERYGSNAYRPLAGCDAAAAALAKLTMGLGFGSVTLLNDSPCKAHVEAELRTAAAQARDGDLVVFTFAGHGDQVADLDRDEPQDQAFVLYDRYLVDDDVYAILGTFDRGVRVVVVADCCYAGSIITNQLLVRTASRTIPGAPMEHGPFFLRPPVAAEVVLLSACSDTTPTAAPRGQLPHFTERLLRLVTGAEGHPPETYEELACRIGGKARTFALPEGAALRLQTPFAI
jgi:hypothetical protein